MASGERRLLSEGTQETLAEYKVDIICGGFPCQPVSLAGKRKVQQDERWLWPEFFRVISLLRPRYALIENVPGLLVHGLSDILRDMASIGYDAEWDRVSAHDFGAPHLRQRVFVVAYPRGIATNSPILTKNSTEVGEGTAFWCKDWEQFALVSSVFEGQQKWRQMGQPGLVRIDDGIPDVLDRLRALGNAVVPQVAEWIGRRIIDYHHV